MGGNLDSVLGLKSDFNKAFNAIKTSGTFARWETLPTTPPAAFLFDGIEEINLPLGEEQIRELIAKARLATSDRGNEATVLSFLEPEWQSYLVDLSKRVASKLGLDHPIRLDLYRMLILGTGAMFKPDTDTERIPGMFGTLVICLPSAHTGGEVVVKHNDECHTLRTSDATQSFACWYSDVTHEVLPVQSGYRCCLTYNLAIRPGHPRPAASVLDLKKVPLRKTLQRWLENVANSNTANEPSHLYRTLDHQYKEKTLCFNQLKNNDFARTDALRKLAHELPFEIFLASLEKEEHGTYQSKNYRYSAYDTDSGSDANHHAIDDVDEEETTCVVKSLRALDGTILVRNYDFDSQFCLVDDPFRGLRDPSEDYEYEGEGRGSVTHRYRRSAAVIVRRDKIGEFLAECTFRSPDDYDSCSSVDNRKSKSPGRDDCNSALRYLRQISSAPSAKTSMLDAMCRQYVSTSSKKLNMTDLLKISLKYSHYALFQTVGACHQGLLPVEFFDWAKEWLDKLRNVSLVEMYYQTWIPLLIQAYPSMADSMSIIRKMSNPSGDAAVPDRTWAHDVILRCVQSFPETNKRPTRSDAEWIVCAIFELEEAWASTHALFTSIFDRFPQIGATAFLLEVLFQLKTQGQAKHLAIPDTVELYKSLSSRVFNGHRKLSDIVSPAKSKPASEGLSSHFHYQRNTDTKKTSENDLVVTPRALAQFAYDLNQMSTDAANLLEPFIQEITEQCATFSAEDMDSLWMPFLHELIPVLASRSVSLNTPTYQRLVHQFVKHSEDKAVGPHPQAGVTFAVPEVACTCGDCGGLNSFLRNPSQRVGRFPMALARRQHLERELEKAQIVCTQETQNYGSPHSLIITKHRTLQDELKEWTERQNKLYGGLTRHIRPEHLRILLGAHEAARVQSLAVPRQEPTARR
ncbi:uncharacterized protein PGTG_22446 [Puccinia graminis f. sp. tritici CRL 75-36-700-3]|uniref:Prolyl 4-hydroxylase alpha subunit Fe(2+) 2OG dioxygenase domain-containing protein n=1 Tax=Puccinia graminis f. sp. tritici (strain CRL 75-36-700-3 / race SCCL) TaxID=418459 RepID=H6QUG7_PUCGT|nr:uncharacterized protein PGTG_22446 [Puccinia graminis f. sp. tritici CRL 75-36-700-3]EHS64630.1 hypothetical protein PGTG_22446 [Puccinia graminis f. sp. tritici CRL 75-36-700-3]